MEKHQEKIMKDYIRPVKEYYGSGDFDYNLRPSMLSTIKHALGGNPQIEKLEDLIMETYMDLIKKDKFYTPALFIREVKKRYIRWWYNEIGLNQRGEVPKGGKRFHISNIYSEDGNNLVENMGYDEDGNLVIGTDNID